MAFEPLFAKPKNGVESPVVICPKEVTMYPDTVNFELTVSLLLLPRIDRDQLHPKVSQLGNQPIQRGLIPDFTGQDSFTLPGMGKGETIQPFSPG